MLRNSLKQSLNAPQHFKAFKYFKYEAKNFTCRHAQPAVPFLSPMIYNKCPQRLSSQGVSKQPEIHLHENRLEANVPRWPQALNLSYVWLRDHCRCPECYNHKTFQRKKDIFEVPLNIRPVSVSFNASELNVEWPDGHTSSYSLQFLWQNTLEGQSHSITTSSPVTWNKMSFPSLEAITVPLSKIREGTEGTKKLMGAILKFGVGFVSEVEPDVESTRRVVEEIAPVHKTFFGEMWTVENDYKYMDTAYSTEFLGAHTDCTYLSEACRIQIFHCLKMAEEGGETLLVDGFHIAEELRKSEPKSYDYLSSHAIPSEYVEEGRHYKSLDVVFKHHPLSKRLKQFRFNLYDRAPLSSLPFDQIDAYYRHLRQLVSRVRKPSNEFWIKLEPGQVLFIDNYRVMHGRNQFRGSRLFSGCYLGNAEFLNKARVLGFSVD